MVERETIIQGLKDELEHFHPSSQGQSRNSAVTVNQTQLEKMWHSQIGHSASAAGLLTLHCPCCALIPAAVYFLAELHIQEYTSWLEGYLFILWWPDKMDFFQLGRGVVRNVLLIPQQG